MGTPALTTLGMGPDEMRTVGRLMARVLGNREDEKVLEDVRREVREVAEAFPVPWVTDRARVVA